MSSCVTSSRSLFVGCLWLTQYSAIPLRNILENARFCSFYVLVRDQGRVGNESSSTTQGNSSHTHYEATICPLYYALDFSGSSRTFISGVAASWVPCIRIVTGLADPGSRIT
jgi:hypothetical protein